VGRTFKLAGFTDRINPKHWNEAWRLRRHVQVDGHGSILGITIANEYIRIVRSNAAGPRPFAVYQYRSQKYRERPKTEFYVRKLAPVFMNSAQVQRIVKHLTRRNRKKW